MNSWNWNWINMNKPVINLIRCWFSGKLRGLVTLWWMLGPAASFSPVDSSETLRNSSSDPSQSAGLSRLLTQCFKVCRPRQSGEGQRVCHTFVRGLGPCIVYVGLCRFTRWSRFMFISKCFSFCVSVSIDILEIFSWSNKNTGLRRVMKLWYQPELNVPCLATVGRLLAFVNWAISVALHDIFRQFLDFHFGSFGSFRSLTCDVKHTISHDLRPVLLIGFVRAALMWGIEWNSVCDLRFALCNVEFYDLSICM